MKSSTLRRVGRLVGFLIMMGHYQDTSTADEALMIPELEMISRLEGPRRLSTGEKRKEHSRGD